MPPIYLLLMSVPIMIVSIYGLIGAIRADYFFSDMIDSVFFLGLFIIFEISAMWISTMISTFRPLLQYLPLTNIPLIVVMAIGIIYLVRDVLQDRRIDNEIMAAGIAMLYTMATATLWLRWLWK